ncbi:MAG: C39 family peptidase [Ruminococcus sp.]|nr:C39 family peptidase [Ruminococcus sp.]
MKKIFCLLAVMTLTACGNKTENSVNPLGSVETKTTATVSQTVTETTTENTATQTTTRKNRNVKKSVSEKVVIDVPYYSQKDYPTGCELVSMSMVLAFYGFDIKAGDIIKKGYLDSAEIYTKKSIKYSGDPNKVFIGNPNKNSGYGCMSGAVILALQRYLSPQEHKLNKKYEITDLGGMSLEEICENYIDNGIPVIVWCSINMKPTFTNLRNSWIIENTGERYIWKSNEHCLVLVGYDDENYYFNDPLVKKETKYMKRLAERRYGEMGMQAVVVEEVSQ